MSVPIDPANPSMLHRQGASYSASLFGGEEQPVKGRPMNGARRVEPVEESEKGRAAKDSVLREERRDREREPVSPDREVEDRPEVAANSYDRKLSYEADVNRVYLDIVNTRDDEVLLRLPSESTAKYLEQITAQSEDKDDAKSASRILEII